MRPIAATCCLIAALWTAAPVAAAPVPAIERPDPMDQRVAVLKALRNNDMAGLLLAQGGEAELEAFLAPSAPADEAPELGDSAGMAPNNDELLWRRLWQQAGSPAGVASISAEFYPKWNAEVPKALAGAQIILAGVAQEWADNQELGSAEKSQLLELQWALTGWLSRTDFADRQHFDQVLQLLAGLVRASGVTDPMLLDQIPAETRLRLGGQTIAAVKQAMTLYGLDADAILASVRLETVSSNGDRVSIRTSVSVLGVPLVLTEQLEWVESQGDWFSVAAVARMKQFDDEAQAEAEDFADDAAATTDEPDEY